MKLLKKHFVLFELLFIALLSLIPLLWFKPEHMIFGSDSGYPLDYIQYFIQRTFTWASSQSFGEDTSTFMGALPLHGLQYILSLSHIPYFAIQKVTLVFWFASVSLSMYFCVRYFFREKDKWPIRIISTLLYSINFYIFLFWTIGSQTTLSAYVFLPIFFLITFRLINKEISPLKAALYINAFFLFYNAGGVAGLPLLGPIIAVGVCLFIYQGILEFNRQYLKSILFFIFYSFVFFVCLNSYYLLPFVLSFTQQFGNLAAKNGGIQGVLEWTKFISQFDNYSNLFRLQGDNIWYVNNNSYPRSFLTNPFLIVSSFVFPILAYLTLLFLEKIKDKKLLLFLIPLSLVGIFLAAGSHEPLGFLYEAMIKFIPGFAAFRSAFYKFMPIVIFAFAILDGIAVYYISQSIKARYRNLLPCLLVLFLFIFHYPFFDEGNFLTNNKFATMVKVPDYITEFTNTKPPSTEKYRTLVLPPLNSNFSVEIYDWEYYSGYPIFPGVSNKPYVEANSYLNENEKILVNRLYDYLRNKDYEMFTLEAKRLGIKYILLTSDVNYKYPDGPRESPQFYDARLENDNFAKIWEKGKWKMYEITSQDINPIVFTFGHLQGFNGSVKSLPTQTKNDLNFFQNLTDDNRNSWTENNITPISCVTCALDQDLNLEIKPPRILPNSIFYPLKKYVEQRAISEISNNDISFLLGSSLKRMSELYGLTGIKRVGNSRPWISAINNLNSNWENIGKTLDEKYESLDLAALKIAKQYSEFEVATLKEIYTTEAVIYNRVLAQKLRNVIAAISKIQEKNDLQIYALESKDTFIFRPLDPGKTWQQDVILDYRSLAAKSGKTIYPNLVQYDEQTPQAVNSFSENSNIILPKAQEKYSRIKLSFPNVSANINIRKEIVNTAYTKSEMCLIADVSDFAWYKKYNVSAHISGKKDNLSVYIVKGKRDKLRGNEFKADKTIEIQKRNISSLVLNVNNSQQDNSLTVYFCSDPGRDPESAFKNLKIAPRYEPLLYFEDKPEINEIGNTKPNYEKISPTEYKVRIKNATKPYFLGFSDRFSHHWKLFINGKELKKSHFILNSYANGWYIDKKGSYDLEIKFFQQDIFRLGLIISSISIMILIISIIAVNIRKKK